MNCPLPYGRRCRLAASATKSSAARPANSFTCSKAAIFIAPITLFSLSQFFADHARQLLELFFHLKHPKHASSQRTSQPARQRHFEFKVDIELGTLSLRAEMMCLDRYGVLNGVIFKGLPIQNHLDDQILAVRTMILRAYTHAPAGSKQGSDIIVILPPQAFLYVVHPFPYDKGGSGNCTGDGYVCLFG